MTNKVHPADGPARDLTRAPSARWVTDEDTERKFYQQCCKMVCPGIYAMCMACSWACHMFLRCFCCKHRKRGEAPLWYECCSCFSRCCRRYKDFDDQANRWDTGVSAAPRPTWLPSLGKGNRDQPVENWAMTLRQLNRFIDACDATRTFWELKARNDPRKEGRYVNLYDLNKHFVIPWTRGTGNSIALLMNADSPLTAQLMVSHGWGEDVEEFLVALNSFFREHSMDRNLAIWVCTLAQYQANDGPTVAEQVAREPFKTVIQSPCVRMHGMCVVHTTRCEVYQRLWCVHEIDEALSLGLQVRPAFSPEYLVDGLGDTISQTVNLKTAEAKCGCPEDEERIRMVVRDKQGGFERLDTIVWKFRSEKVMSNFGNFGQSVAKKFFGDEFERELQRDFGISKENEKLRKGAETPIISAARAGQANKVKELIAAGADIDARDNMAMTALMHAGLCGDLACVQALLAAKADVQAKDETGITALMATARAGQANKVKELIAAGADIDARDNLAMTALMHASLCGDLACVQALLAAEADVQAEDKTGITALMASANPPVGQSKVEALRKTEAILSAGADVNHSSTKAGRTPLMGAAFSDNPAIVQVLLAAKADMAARDNEEQTALDMAQKKKHKECQKILEEAAGSVCTSPAP